MEQWLAEHEYESISQLKGSVSQQHAIDPSAYERANYVQVLDSYSQPGGGVEVGFVARFSFPRSALSLMHPDLRTVRSTGSVTAVHCVQNEADLPGFKTWKVSSAAVRLSERLAA